MIGIISSIQTIAQVLGGLGASFLFSVVVDDSHPSSLKTGTRKRIKLRFTSGTPFFIGAALHAIGFVTWIWWFRRFGDQEDKSRNKKIAA